MPRPTQSHHETGRPHILRMSGFRPWLPARRQLGSRPRNGYSVDELHGMISLPELGELWDVLAVMQNHR